MVCRCDLWVLLFGRGIYFANCANVKICPGSAPVANAFISAKEID